MKYTNSNAFEKHVKEASPHHFSPIYLIVGKEGFLRKEAEKFLVKMLLSAHGLNPLAAQTYDAERSSIESVLEELASFSFFAEKKILTLHRTDKLNKEATTALESYFESPAPSTYLILTADAINRGTKFYKKCELAGVILDLPEEKPWEKENNLALKLISWAKEAGKTMSTEAARYLIQFTGTDFSLLYSEMQKLFCYTADKTAIALQDIEEICTGMNTKTIWQLGDFIFQKNCSKALKTAASILRNGAPFFSLVRQLRSQFQTKLQILSILSSGGGPEEIQQRFPYMRGQILQQNMQAAKQYGISPLKKGILLIDESELLAKSSSLAMEFILERLIINLTG